MLIASENPRISDLVKYEQAPEHGFCREEVVFDVSVGPFDVTAGAVDFKIGTVLAIMPDTGYYVLRDPAGTDGSEVAAAILLENVSVASPYTKVTAAVNGAMIVREAALQFPNAHTPAQIATTVAELAAVGIKTRTGI